MRELSRKRILVLVQANWKVMGIVLRLTTVAGLSAGSLSLAVALYVIASINWSNVTGPFFIFQILLFGILLFLLPLVTLGGSIRLLFRPMSLEQRGVVGFITFVTAILSILVTGFFFALSMTQ